MIKKFWGENKTGFLISTGIVAIGSLILHARFNQPINLNQFFLWLPIPLILLFVMAFGLSFIFGGKE